MERNVMGELNVYRGSGAKPNFSEIARRHGMDRHTVAKYWREGESASRTPATHSSLPSSAGLPLLWGIGAAGDMSSMSAYFATVFRLTWSIRAISDLERPAASIDRISFTVSRGTVISSILPGRARQSNHPGKPYGEGRAPGPRGAALLLKLLNFSCSRCLFPSDHSDHFLVNINKPSWPWRRDAVRGPQIEALVNRGFR